MKGTHIINKKEIVSYLPVKFQIGVKELEYVIQYMIQEKRPVISDKSVKKEIANGLLQCGLAYWDGLLNTYDISSDAVKLSKKLFPSFYKQLPVGSKG